MTGAEARQLRERTGLSLRELGRLMRLHHMTLWRYEQDRRKVPPQYGALLSIMARVARPCPHCGGTGVERSERA
jgi:transcriptional regulator with XRE-family HTH domain